MENKKKKKRIAMMALAIVSLIAMTIGVTYAFFSYIGSGTTENTISSGALTFLYDEMEGNGNGITITNGLPVDDTTGEAGDYFEFQIVSKATTTVAIPYEINVRQKPGTDNIGNIIKLYLTKVDSTTGTETQVALSKFSDLTDVTKNGHSEKALYDDMVPASNSTYTQKYRLRMWIDNSTSFNGVTTPAHCSDANITEQELCVSPAEWIAESTTYPYNGKTFAVTVNVYANGRTLTNGALYAVSEVSYTAPAGSNSECTGANATVDCALNELSDRIR